MLLSSSPNPVLDSIHVPALCQKMTHSIGSGFLETVSNPILSSSVDLRHSVSKVVKMKRTKLGKGITGKRVEGEPLQSFFIPRRTNSVDEEENEEYGAIAAVKRREDPLSNYSHLLKKEAKPKVERGVTFDNPNPVNKNLPEVGELEKVDTRPPLKRGETYSIFKEFKNNDPVQGLPGFEPNDENHILNRTFNKRRYRPIPELGQEKKERRRKAKDEVVEVPVGVPFKSISSPKNHNAREESKDQGSLSKSISKSFYSDQSQTSETYNKYQLIILRHELTVRTHQIDNKKSAAFENDEKMKKMEEELTSLKVIVDEHNLREFQVVS